MNKKPFTIPRSNHNILVVGKTGTGRSFTELLNINNIAGTEKEKLIFNNYRKRKHIPMIHKKARSYKFRKFYKERFLHE